MQVKESCRGNGNVAPDHPRGRDPFGRPIPPSMEEPVLLTDVFVPVLTYPEATPAEALNAAASLARLFARSLDVCAFEIDIPDLRNRMGAAFINVEGMAAAAEARSRGAAHALLSQAEAIAAPMEARTETVRVTLDQVGSAAARRARYHDLALVSLDNASSDHRALAESLVFGSGRPVMLVPHGSTAGTTIDHVAIAWDATAAASRAVHDAMPLLAVAGSVSLLTAGEEKDIAGKSVAAITAHLERHGLRVSHVDLPVAGQPVGAVLQDGARSQGAGLLVMGAFGHSRVRDFVLGGATRLVLENLRVPVLLSH